VTPQIDPTATVADSAIIRPGAVIGAQAVIGPHCIIEHYGIVGAHTTLGRACHIHPFAVVGGPAQDRRTAPDEPHLLTVGDRNTFREGSTISRGTSHGVGTTRIGHDNLFMAHSHVGHDCVIGNGVTLSNGVSLAGHVMIDDCVSLGGHSAVHQFVRVGQLAFIAANAMVSRDVLPFCLAAGDRARLRGLNITGLHRAGLSDEAIVQLKKGYRALFRRNGRPVLDCVMDLSNSPFESLRAWAEFAAKSERGLMSCERTESGATADI